MRKLPEAFHSPFMMDSVCSSSTVLRPNYNSGLIRFVEKQTSPYSRSRMSDCALFLGLATLCNKLMEL